MLDLAAAAASPGARIARDASARMRHALHVAAERGHRAAALLGAGRHTAKVLAALYDPPLTIAGFIDERAEPGTTRCGWRVVPPAQARSLNATALILNSDACEPELWSRRAEFEALGFEVFRLYPEHDDQPSPRAVPRGHDIRRYWQTRGDGGAGEDNAPRSYLRRVGWSVLLADAIAERGVPRDAAILEPGCNIGRNLALLLHRGYRNLHGIDVNPNTRSVMRECFPQLADGLHLTIGAMEDVLPTVADGAYDVVFTLATLMCVPPENERVLDELVRICRGLLITLEFEAGDGERHFGRDYGQVFASRGLREVRRLPFKRAGADLIRLFELEPEYVLRVFER